MRVRRILLGGFTAALLGGAFVYPLYPSQHSICEIMEERSRNDDRWASPHRGAVVALRGELYGVPMAGAHQYAFLTRCKGYDYFLAIDGSQYALSSFGTRDKLHQLQAGDWHVEERHAPFTLTARVSSEVQGCFSPPMVLTALAMQAQGDVKVDRRAHPIAP
jgi:hypothetical protein